MKRDINLIRAILQFAEENCDGTRAGTVFTADKLPKEYRSVDDLKLKEHLTLVDERKLLDWCECEDGELTFFRLTWAGHDFIATPTE
jgi:hypothetical protein